MLICVLEWETGEETLGKETPQQEETTATGQIGPEHLKSASDLAPLIFAPDFSSESSNIPSLPLFFCY